MSSSTHTRPGPIRWAGALLAPLAAAAALAALAFASAGDSPSDHADGPSPGRAGAGARAADAGAAPVRRLRPVAQHIEECPGVVPAAASDLDLDGAVDERDRDLLLQRWGTSDAQADLNGDGHVDGADLGLLLGDWTGAHAPATEGRP